MAVVAYERHKFFWGLAESESGPDPYEPEEKTALGENAVEGNGVGARRAQLVFTRTPPGTASEDVAVMHFDFLNLTNGDPDDTWTTSDYTAVENQFTIWWQSIASHVTVRETFKEVRWYRAGTGVRAPNPPERVTAYGQPGTSGTVELPPQCASTVSLHCARRTSWGRTYLPGLTLSAIQAGGILTNAFVDDFANASAGLVNGAAAADMHLVILSVPAAAALTVEEIAVDSIVDIQRSRRWEHPTRRTVLPIPAARRPAQRPADELDAQAA